MKKDTPGTLQRIITQRCELTMHVRTTFSVFSFISYPIWPLLSIIYGVTDQSNRAAFLQLIDNRNYGFELSLYSGILTGIEKKPDLIVFPGIYINTMIKENIAAKTGPNALKRGVFYINSNNFVICIFCL